MTSGADREGRRHWAAKSMFPRSSGGWLPLLAAVACGVAAGIGAYTFSYAKGLSYFGTDPKACVNCHIMEPEYAGWQKSSHHTVARCVDCHLPASFVSKYIAKAENGYRHGKLFTTQTFEEPITVKAAGLEILQENCERCHATLIDGLVGAHASRGRERWAATSHTDPLDGAAPCLHCHHRVGHGDRAGLGGPLTEAEVKNLELSVTQAERRP